MSKFCAGELALLLDRKGRRYLIRLKAGASFQSHTGTLPHDDIISSPPAVELRNSGGSRFTAYRPTLEDYILKMPRGAQVIYPKDLGAILMFADIAPGQKILESGIGSGALSMALLRIGAKIVGYEINEQFAERAHANVREFLGAAALKRYNVKIADSYAGIKHRGFDRMLLDLPEPWRVVPHAPSAVRAGGIVLSYSPSILQVSQFTEACHQAGLGEVETIEVLHRGWHVKGQAVRPDHRMVAHTGFLTRAKILG